MKKNYLLGLPYMLGPKISIHVMDFADELYITRKESPDLLLRSQKSRATTKMFTN